MNTERGQGPSGASREAQVPQHALEAPLSYFRLEELLKTELPSGVTVTSYRHAGNDIVLGLDMPSAVPRAEIERVRQDVERRSGWNVAFEYFIYDPSIDSRIVDTIRNIAPSKPDIRGVFSAGREITVYASNLGRIFGRRNTAYLRMRAALNGAAVGFRLAPDDWASKNLSEVDRRIGRALDSEGVLGKVREMCPESFHVRSLWADFRQKMVVIRYGTGRVSDEEREALEAKISEATGWRIHFTEVVDSYEMVRAVRESLPVGLPRSRVGFHENGCVLVTCHGDLTNRPVLLEYCRLKSAELPVEVRFRLILNEEAKRRIISEVVPEAWACQSIAFSDQRGTAVLKCAQLPSNHEAVDTVLREITERTGCRTVLAEDAYQVADPVVDQKARELVPEACGYSHATQHIVSGNVVIYVRRNPQLVKVRSARAALGGEVVIKIAPEEATKSRYIKALYNCLEHDRQVAPLHVRAPKSAVVTGYGACEEIGRSAFYMEISGLRVLLDCGASFGAQPYPSIPAGLIKKLDFVIVSHAHADHSAMVPWLFKNGCKAQVLGTEPTLVIGKLLMEDYLKVQKVHKHEEPAYKKEDIRAALAAACVVSFDRTYPLSDDVSVTFLNAGHIPGAAMILIQDRDRKLLYSGDIALQGTRLLQAAQMPQGLTDVLIETTYGGRSHGDRRANEAYLTKKVMEALERGGTVIIPAFAVGRAQDVLLILSEQARLGFDKDFPVYVDGLILKVNDICRSYLGSRTAAYFNPQLLQSKASVLTEQRTFFRAINDREAIARDRGAKVIVTTSGMCEGPAGFYLSKFSADPRNLLMQVGYQAEGTTGRLLREGATRLNIDGTMCDIALEVDSANLSAHADKRQLIAALAGQKYSNLLLIHGEEEARQHFQEQAQTRLKAENIIRPTTGAAVRLY